MKTKKLTLCLVWFFISAIIAFTVTATFALSANLAGEGDFGDPLSTLRNLTVVLSVIGIILSIIVTKIFAKEEVKENEAIKNQESIQIPVSKPESDD